MVTIEVISNSKNYLAFGTKEGKDYGMILKVKNNRFPKHFFFVCAGIKIWGSWGAAWFLSQQWKNLYKEFGAEEFGVVVEVHRNIITSAIRVYP